MTTPFCGDCGSPSVRADQRFCLTCGSALSVEAPAPDSPPAPATWGPAATYASPTPEYAVPVRATTDRSGPRLGKVLGVGAIVLALGGAGFVGWQVLGPKGGAGTPEEAVRGFVDAVVKQDGVGLLDVIVPGEVKGVDAIYRAAQERLEEEGLTNGSSITDAVSIELSGLEFDVEEVGEHAARVALVVGDYKVSYDPSKLPDRLDFVADAAPDPESDSGDLAEALQVYDSGSDDYVDFAATAVEVDGGWYVSLVATAADQIGNEVGNRLREPDYDVLGEELEPIVGNDPEEVVDNLVAAINERDAEQTLANLPADLVVGLRPFVRSIDGWLRDNGLSGSLSVDNLDLKQEDLGDGLLKVTIDGANAYGEAYTSDDSASGTLEVSGGCFYVSGTGGGYEYYDDETGETYSDDGYDEGRGCIGDVPELGDLGIEDAYVVMREVDGGYQLDPVATAVVYAQTAIESVPSSLIDDLLAEIEDDVSSTGDCYDDFEGEYYSC